MAEQEGDEGPVQTLLESTIDGDLVEVERLIGRDPCLLNARDACFNRTPLMMAAREGHFNLVKFLVDKGAELDARNSNGNTALYWACLSEHGCHSEIVKYLLDAGADPTLRTVCGRNCLMAASANGHLELVQLLIGRLPVDQADHYGMTALWRACQNGKSRVVKALLEEGGASLSVSDAKGRTPLQIAKDEGHRSCVTVIEAYQKTQGVSGGADGPASQAAAE